MIEDQNISCNVSLDEKKALVFSIPYAKGWTAVVNGKEMELKKANTMFMALELEPGDYEIELHYMTAWLIPGLVLSLLGVLLFVIVVIVNQRGKRNQK